MSQCHLELELENGEGPYQPGQTVNGRLFIQSDQALEAKSIVITYYWQTSGKGNVRKGGERNAYQAGSTHLDPNQPTHVDFAFEVPTAPLSYSGQILSVTWYVEARLDVPWSIDPKTKTSFGIDPGPMPESVEPPQISDLSKLDILKKQSALGKGCLFIFSLPFLLSGMGMLIFGHHIWMMIIMGIVFSLAGGFLAFMAIRSSVAARKLGKVDLALERYVWNRGETLKLKLSFPVAKPVTINVIRVCLKGEEHTESGSGKNRHSYSHVFHKDERLEDVNAHLMPGQGMDVSFEIPLPPELPVSMYMGSNQRIKYSLDVTIDIPGWPDWHESPMIILAHPGLPLDENLFTGLPNLGGSSK
ncbi:MAG: sporulation protein [Acidobacteria bacterium]|nr:sporulation protein [Acidobacteriota bacterium]MCB9398992.1 sporulation protein [Acidobacteriota bacterium]